MNQRQKRLGEILIEMGVIDEEAVNIALMEQKATGAKLGEILVKMGFATETAVSKALAVQYGIEMITMRDISIQKAREVLKLLDDPKRFLERKVIPIKVEDRTVHLALGNPSLDIQIQVEKAVRTKGYDAVFYVIPQSEADILSHVVYQSSDFAEQFDQHLERALAYERDGNPTNLAIPPLVDTLINFAIVSGASDVHIIGEAGVCRVFFRTDGVFKYVKAIPSSILPKITATIKQRSGMDAADRLRTQDGHMIHTMGSRSVNIRVSYLPLVDRAESLVLRILDENRVILDIDKLGFYEDDLKTIKQALRHPHGLILVTGPTGSGKTTTLYSIIMYLSGFRYSILTIEDPVEYRLPFVRQCQVNRYVDVTPEKMLRAFLRHDPDV
ncbi:MAG: ATPase, T2SS/T4P/T4SS family, partial [Thermoproteota archaeon]